jgi:cobalt-zinc-cadmium efflux system outer membrane protein
MKPITLILAMWLAAVAWPVEAEQPYRLDQLLELAAVSNKNVAATAAGVDAARAGITTAQAYPNPEVEWLSGRASARQAGAATGATQTFSVTQRIDLPSQRLLRRDIANRTLEATTAGQGVFLSDLMARVKQGYYETLRRQAEFQAAEEDLALTQQIYQRAQVRVDVGDAPRYELIRAEAELLNAQKNEQSALLRVSRAKSLLRQQVGEQLPSSFALAGSLGRDPAIGHLETLRGALRETNPELRQLRSELQRAGLAVDYERSLRLPTVSLRAAAEREPDVQNTRIGVVLSVPLWDRRKGPIDEAAAQVIRVRSLLEAREFELLQELDSAYQQFQIAASQADAFESGIVRQAQAALRVAEAAYRFGERGIIDFLDAQRVLRIARNELIAAQYDLQLAAVEIDRLLANPSAGQ